MNAKLLFRFILMGLMLSALVLSGCEGDDGDDGRNGADGTNGASAYEIAGGDDVWGSEEEWLASLSPTSNVPPVEGCALCHANGKAQDANIYHDITGEVTFYNAVATTVGDDVEIDFDVLVDGMPTTGFDVSEGTPRRHFNDSALVELGVANGYVRESLDGDLVSIVDNGGGSYTATIVNAAILETPASATNITYMIHAANGTTDDDLFISVVAGDAQLARDVVSNDGCYQCHGPHVFDSNMIGDAHHGANPQGVDACVICHTRASSADRDTDDGTGGMRTTAYVHGIHNSHNMPERYFPAPNDTVLKPDGVWPRRNRATESNWYSIGYPSYMNNCSVCHQDNLEVVKDMPVTYAGCLSCHDSWEGFDWAGTAEPFKDYHVVSIADDNTIDCTDCHRVGGAAAKLVTVSDAHNGLLTGRSGVIWDGEDVSVTEGAKVDTEITGVRYNGAIMSVTWTAAYDGTPVDPCGKVATATIPIFDGDDGGNQSLLRAYGQADDWTNDNISSKAGIAVSTNLSTDNTSCDGLEATTTITLTAAELATTATKAVVGLQGKARLAPPSAALGTTMQVRSKSPVFEFVVSSGDEQPNPRRELVDTEKCLECHVGSLYQHGGNRVDNVALCVMCHNEASNDQDVREGYGVDASEAYDGLPGQTVGFKSLLHAVHAAGATGKTTVNYRSFGIFLWTGEDTVIPNYPGDGLQTIYGSDPSGTNPDGTSRNHNRYVVHFPRALNNCEVCHVEGGYNVPDQTQSVATTIATGVSYTSGTDDVLEGTSAAACTSCHSSGFSTSHAYSEGWYPTTFKDGRETIIEAAE